MLPTVIPFFHRPLNAELIAIREKALAAARTLTVKTSS